MPDPDVLWRESGRWMILVPYTFLKWYRNWCCLMILSYLFLSFLIRVNCIEKVVWNLILVIRTVNSCQQLLHKRHSDSVRLTIPFLISDIELFHGRCSLDAILELCSLLKMRCFPKNAGLIDLFVSYRHGEKSLHFFSRLLTICNSSSTTELEASCSISTMVYESLRRNMNIVLFWGNWSLVCGLRY